LRENLRELRALLRGPDKRAEGPDHGEDARDVTLVEGMDRNPCADQIGHDRRLEV
jgi:hypothetical protein